MMGVVLQRASWLSVVGPLFVLAACGEPEVEEAPPTAPAVRVEVLETTAWTPVAESVATLDAVRQASLRSEAAGRVIERSVNAGDRVTAGQVLLRLDVGRVATALQAANAQVGQAQVALAQAERQRALAARLVEAGGAPRGRLDDATDGVRLAQSAVEAAQAQTRLTRRGIAESVVRAPFDGTIAEVFAQEGEFIGPGTPVALLVDPSELEARVLVDPRDALDLPIGSVARIEAHARPGEVFTGEVVRIGEVVDPRTRRLPVVVRVEDPDRRLRAGLSARVRIDTGAPADVLSVPLDAVFERYGQSQVFVVPADSDVAERVPVQVGRAQDGRFAVEGLEAGARVIVAGIDRVVAGRPVQVVEAVVERLVDPEPAP